MTLSTTGLRITYSGNGVTDTFSFPYRFLKNEDLVVSVDGVTQVLNTDYTVSGAGGGSGGTVTMTTAPASDAVVIIIRELKLTQEIDYITGDPFPAQTHEKALDRLTMIAQQLNRVGERSLKISEDDIEGVNTTLPAPEASRYLRWNDTGNALENETLVSTLYSEGELPVQYSSVAALKLASLNPGIVAQTKGYYTAGDGGQAEYLVQTATAYGSTPDGYGDHTLANGNVAVLQTSGVVNVKQFGAVNGDLIDIAIAAAISTVGDTGAVELDGDFRLSAPVVLPTTAKQYHIFSRSHSTLTCEHNGDGIVLNTVDYTYGGHTLENITLDGPNAKYPPATYTPPSTGAGLRLATAYDNTFKNVRVTGFLYGLYIKTGFNNKTVGDCQFLFNQHGVYIDGGATNLNKISAKIRENRLRGVTILGTGGAPYPTKNSFSDSYIETNIPYNAGYPVGGPGDASTSCGVYLDNTYSNDFDNVYFENQEFDVWIEGGASYNSFSQTRHAPSADKSRVGKIKINGQNSHSNTFYGCQQISFDTTTPNVEITESTVEGTSFTDCVGFSFIDASIASPIHIVNNRKFLNLYGTDIGVLSYPPQGYYSNPQEGTTIGRIDGIGTTTATLYAQGLSEVQFGSQITADTSITSVNGLVKHQIFTLWNYQEGNEVTIVSSGKTGGLVLAGLRDAKFTQYGQSITFLVNGLGRLTEIGRNFSVDQVGTATITDTNTSTTVTLPIAEPDYNFKIFVTNTAGSGDLGSRRVYVSGRTLTTIVLATEVAPGAGNSIPIDWCVKRNY